MFTLLFAHYKVTEYDTPPTAHHLVIYRVAATQCFVLVLA